MAGVRESRREGNPSTAANRRANVQGVDIFVDHVTRLQYGAHIVVHIVCIQNTKNTGKFQRSEVYRVHHVFHVHSLASIFTHLFRHQ